MSDFSDSSTGAASGEGGLESASSPQVLQAGLAALKQKDYATAIVHLKAVYQGTIDSSMRLKAQVGLIKAYARTENLSQALALCDSLRRSSNSQVKSWATQTWQELTRRSTADEGFADDTGFVPLDGAAPQSSPRPMPQPEIQVESETDDMTGFTLLSQPPASPAPADRAAARVDRSPPASVSRSPELPPSAELPAPPELPSAAPEDATQVELPVDESIAAAGAEAATAQSSELVTLWRQAGRAQKWASLGNIDFSPLWALSAGTAVVLFLWLNFCLTQGVTIAYKLLSVVSWPINLQVLAYEKPAPGWLLLLTLVTMFFLSPWLLDFILKQFYGLQLVSMERMAGSSPETARLLRRIAVQRRKPAPTMGVLPGTVPIVFSYGYLPRNARIVVSQAVVQQLSDEEVAALCAAELSHILDWDAGLMTLVTLVAQIPYLMYWHLSGWGDQQGNAVLRAPAILLASLAYGLYWICRLPGLWLSRVRLYYSDRVASDLTGNPNGLVRALLKLNLAIASETQRRGFVNPLLESFDLLTPVEFAPALSLGSLYPQTPTPALLEWDRSNPYRRWLSVRNSHPPLGDRLNLLTRYARQWRLDTELNWDDRSGGAPGSRKPTFRWRRLLLQGAPFFGVVIGLSFAALLWLVGWVAGKSGVLELDWLWGDDSLLRGFSLIGFSIGMMLRINPSFPDIRRSNVQNNPDLAALLSDPTLIPISSLPVRLQGKLLGRRGTGNWLSQDLVLLTSTGGILPLHYTSQLGWLGDLLFPGTRPWQLVNEPVTVVGWLRRGVTPWLEVDTIQPRRGADLRSAHPIWSTLLATIAAILGAFIILKGGS